MTSRPEQRFFNTGEVAVNYTEWPGNKPGFVFIHGITGRHETWDDVIGQVRQESHAIAVDLRGHGRSGHTHGKYMLPDYARDVARLMEEKTGPAVIVGHSLGAMTAIQLASEYPGLVSAIVLEDPPLFARRIMEEFEPERHERFGNNARLASSGMALEQLAEQVRSAAPDAPEEEVTKSALSLFVTDGDAVMHVYDQRIDWSREIEQKLRSVQCPVLLMQGNFELGAWMLPEDGPCAAGLMGNCTLQIWDDTGHGLHSDNPERFVRQVNEFVENLDIADRRA